MFIEIISLFIEPVGTSKPRFSDDVSSKTLKRNELGEITLVCPAQAHPIPAYRLVLYKLLDLFRFRVEMNIQQMFLFHTFN